PAHPSGRGPAAPGAAARADRTRAHQDGERNQGRILHGKPLSVGAHATPGGRPTTIVVRARHTAPYRCEGTTAGGGGVVASGRARRYTSLASSTAGTMSAASPRRRSHSELLIS